MTKGKGTKRQTMTYKTLHRKTPHTNPNRYSYNVLSVRTYTVFYFRHSNIRVNE
jgi:hypothetical protein